MCDCQGIRRDLPVSANMPKSHRFTHLYNAGAPELIELFLVAAVAAVLAIRAFLALTGYPQIGGDGLHIAHMLWGGLFMLLAMLLLFTLVGPAVQRFAAILGGVGFGTFIDELGKFITDDNNYFYEPTIGLIYIIFIAIFLALRVARSRVSPESASSGAAGAETDRASDLRLYFTLRNALARQYRRVALHRWFRPALLAFFAIFALGQIGIVVFLVTVGFTVGTAALELNFAATAQLAASVATGLIVAWGIWRLRRSRLIAYRWFARAMLVSIFVTQVFAFLETEFAALGGLAVSLLIYAALRYMIEQETGVAAAAIR